MPVLRDWKLAITVDHVLAGQGADPAAVRARRSVLVEVAARTLEEGQTLLRPVILYRRLVVEELRDDQLMLAGGNALSGLAVVRHLAAAQAVVVMVGTIGGALEACTAALVADDPIAALALDGLGSSAATLLAIEACRFFDAQAAAEGLQATRPISPGEDGWPVKEGQRELFALLDGAEIGVALLDSAMMLPRKSFSMVLGLGVDVARDEAGTPCQRCNMRSVCRFQHRYV